MKEKKELRGGNNWRERERGKRKGGGGRDET